MKLEIGYVDKWQIRDAKDVHPSHRTAVIEVLDLYRYLEAWIVANSQHKKSPAAQGLAEGLRIILKEIETEAKG